MKLVLYIFSLFIILCLSFSFHRKHIVFGYITDTVPSYKIRGIKEVFGFKGQKKYAYCPYVISEGNNSHIWLCGNDPEGQFLDKIYYITESNKGKSTKPIVVLNQGAPGTWDERHVCDPSIVEGRFGFNGKMYKYAMFYLGNRHNRFYNEIGVAFSNSLDTKAWFKFPKPIIEKTWEGERDYAISTANGNTFNAWGVGQPSVISLDYESKVLLTYTIGDVAGTRVVTRVADLSDMSRLSLTEAHPVSITGLTDVNRTFPDIALNADFAFDKGRKNIYMIRHVLPNPAGYPDYISGTLDITIIKYADFINNRGKWRSIARIDSSITGFPRNHNACILKDNFGQIGDQNKIEFYYTISKSGADVNPDSANHAEWTYHIWKGRLEKIQ